MLFTNNFRYNIILLCFSHTKYFNDHNKYSLHYLVEKLAQQYLHHLLSCCNIIIFNRSKKWVIHTRRGDLGSKTAKQLYNSYRICSDNEDSQYIWYVQRILFGQTEYLRDNINWHHICLSQSFQSAGSFSKGEWFLYEGWDTKSVLERRLSMIWALQL